MGIEERTLFAGERGWGAREAQHTCVRGASAGASADAGAGARTIDALDLT